MANPKTIKTAFKRNEQVLSVESTALEEDVMQVLNKAHKQSHVHGDFEHKFEIERKVSINMPKETAV